MDSKKSQLLFKLQLIASLTVLDRTNWYCPSSRNYNREDLTIIYNTLIDTIENLKQDVCPIIIDNVKSALTGLKGTYCCDYYFMDHIDRILAEIHTLQQQIMDPLNIVLQASIHQSNLSNIEQNQVLEVSDNIIQKGIIQEDVIQNNIIQDEIDKKCCTKKSRKVNCGQYDAFTLPEQVDNAIISYNCRCNSICNLENNNDSISITNKRNRSQKILLRRIIRKREDSEALIGKERYVDSDSLRRSHRRKKLKQGILTRN